MATTRFSRTYLLSTIAFALAMVYVIAYAVYRIDAGEVLFVWADGRTSATDDLHSRGPTIATVVAADDRACLVFYPLMKLDRIVTDRRTVRRNANAQVLVELVSRSFKTW